MTAQSDWVGGAEQATPRVFKDMRNTRESVAEEKARLYLELGSLIKAPPSRVINGSVQIVREWQAARAAAAKSCGLQSTTCGGSIADGWRMAQVRVEPSGETGSARHHRIYGLGRS